MPNTSANMGLIVPIPQSPGVTGSGDTGPGYAVNISNDLLTTIDQHDHSSGKGVKITPQGMNINSDLTLNSNNLTAARSIRFTSQATALSGVGDTSEIFVKTGDLYYINSAGTPVQITAGSQVNVGTLSNTILSRISISTNWTIQASDTYILLSVDTSAQRTIILPPAFSVSAGRWYVIADHTGQAATNNITIQTQGSDTVMGQSNVVIASNYAAVLVASDGSSRWDEVVGLQGPIGATGIQGPTGSIGPPGSSVGITGPQGPQGSPGVTGPAGGPQGSPGVTGPVGSTGTAGSQGSQGIQGATGIQGPGGSPNIVNYFQAGVTGYTGAQVGAPGMIQWNSVDISLGNVSQATSQATGSSSILVNSAGLYEVDYTIVATGPSIIVDQSNFWQFTVQQRINATGAISGGSGIKSSLDYLNLNIAGNQARTFPNQSVSKHYIVSLQSGCNIETWIQPITTSPFASNSTGILLSATGTIITVKQIG